MTSQLDLYNGALLKLGQPRLVTLTDEGTGRRALDDCYAKVVKACLEAGLWNFALRFVEVEADPSMTSSFGFKHAFAKPDDWLRTAGMWEDGNQRAPLLDYEDRGSLWLANRQFIYPKYISIDPDFGLDLGRWPESFVDFVEYRLARTVCIDVTGSESKLERLEADEKRARSIASSRDAMNEAVTKFPPAGRLVRSRGNSRRGEHGR